MGLRPKNCKTCAQVIPITEYYIGRPANYAARSFCSLHCTYAYRREKLLEKLKTKKVTRHVNIGKENYFYRNGNSVGGLRKSLNTKHQDACREYREKFYNENGYLSCELGGTEPGCGENRFETHHIIYASEAPKHPNLHNHRNLILICRKHHHWLHASKARRNTLVNIRKLDELFENLWKNRPNKS